jgi:hypothetical protein
MSGIVAYNAKKRYYSHDFANFAQFRPQSSTASPVLGALLLKNQLRPPHRGYTLGVSV